MSIQFTRAAREKETTKSAVAFVAMAREMHSHYRTSDSRLYQKKDHIHMRSPRGMLCIEPYRLLCCADLAAAAAAAGAREGVVVAFLQAGVGFTTGAVCHR